MLEIAQAFKGRQILITGSTGYLAANVMDALSEVDCRIVGLSRPGAVSPMSATGKARKEFLTGDLSDGALLEKALNGIDVVFHFAAQTSSYKADADPLADVKANVVPMLSILETCRRKNWHPFVAFSGAVTQVGLPDRLPVDETFPDKPVTAYDVHKIFAEDYVKYYSMQGVVTGASLRLANVYGPGPKSSSADRGILNMMVRRALKGEPLTVYGSGKNVRDYVYVGDVASAFLHAAANGERCNGQHFVIGSGEGRSIFNALRTVADTVAKRTKQEVEVKTVPPPEGQSVIESRNFVADTLRFRAATAWIPETSFIEGINLTIDHWMKEKK